MLETLSNNISRVIGIRWRECSGLKCFTFLTLLLLAGPTAHADLEDGQTYWRNVIFVKYGVTAPTNASLDDLLRLSSKLYAEHPNAPTFHYRSPGSPIEDGQTYWRRVIKERYGVDAPQGA